MLEPERPTPHSQSDRTPANHEGLAAQLCAELESEILSGNETRCETYFSKYPELFSDPEVALDLIYAEFIARGEKGSQPNCQEYYDRFPLWRPLLEQQFQLNEWLDESDSGFSRGTESQLYEPSTPQSSRYRIVQLLARGGIGQVMRAVDLELNREVAVKEIQSTLEHNLDVQERFIREAEITGRLEHPGVVPVYGFGRDANGRPFYAMRLVRGQSLSDAIVTFHNQSILSGRYVSVDFQKLLRRFLSVCEAVAYAHSRGIIHRDIKPQNILLGPFGETLIVDWGLAKVLSPRASVPDSHASDTNNVPSTEVPSRALSADWSIELTHSIGTLIGTPAFMSPEQARGDAQSVGTASDIYSLGATLYVMLVGKGRFANSNVDETIRKVIDGGFLSPRDAIRAVPRSLEAICLKAMALRPENRYPSAVELAKDIEHFLADEPVSAMRESLVSKVLRWGRRNRKVAIIALSSLAMLSIVSSVSAFRIHGERVRADRERIEASRQSARLAFDRGYQLIEQHQVGEGVLWLEKAFRHLPTEDLAMRQVVLTNLSASRPYLMHRSNTFAHPVPISLMEFSDNGKSLLTLDLLGVARIWDVDSAKMIRELPTEHKSALAAQLSNDGSVFFVTGIRSLLNLHHIDTDWKGASTRVLNIPYSADTTCIAMDPSGIYGAASKRVETISTVDVYRLSDGAPIATLPSAASVLQIEFLPGSRNIAIINLAGELVVWQWDKITGHYTKTITLEGIYRARVTPNAKKLIAGNRDGYVSVWDLWNGKKIAELGQQVGNITAIACADDSETVAAAWDNGNTRCWDLSEMRPAGEVLRFDRHMSHLKFRPDSRQLLVLAKRNAAVLWKLPDLGTASIPIQQPTIDTVSFSNDGTLAVTSSRNGTTILRNGNSGQPIGRPISHQGAVKQISFSQDGSRLLTASLDGTARLWDTSDGKPIGPTMQHREPSTSKASVYGATFSPNEKWIATSDSAGFVRLWNAQTCQLIRTFPKISGSALSICFSPDSQSILVGHAESDNGIRLWDTETGELRWSNKQRSSIRCVAISPDGRIAISGGNDNTARLWRMSDGQSIGPELENRGEVFVARFSPDSRLALTAGYDATIRLWDTDDGKPFGQPMQHESIVLDAVFRADGKSLMTGSKDMTARWWNVQTCLPLSPPMRHNQVVMQVRMSPTQRLALTDRLWKLEQPLPDQSDIVARWVQLATQRKFTIGNNVQWIEADVSQSMAEEFESLTGVEWQNWPR